MPVATACYPESYNLLKWYYPTEQSWRSSDVPHPVFCSFTYCPDWRIPRFFLAHLVKFRNYILNQATIVLPTHSANRAPTAYTGNICTIRLKCVYCHWFIVMLLFVCSVQYVGLLLFASLCHFIITRFIFFLQRSFYALFSCFVS